MMSASNNLRASNVAHDYVLQVDGLQKSYGEHAVLHHVDLRIRRGEVTFLIGPSGGGKSTLLRCLNFLEAPSAGAIQFAGEQLCHHDGARFRIAPERRLRAARSRMPMVFQQFNLFNHRTVLENVIEGPIHVQGRPREQAIEEARVILTEIGLGARLDYYPEHLSGGQRQRVAIARAMAMKPELILFDEPTSALDPELVAEILESIRRLAAAGMTLVIVTHEMAFARKLADTIHFVADGRIIESGCPETLLSSPGDSRIADFIRSILH
ncbi:ectoine/hydroxyectoine ABC transporter ATP-binding protein EhuA [Pandoraea terrae]|uniref:Ectoine/hydroxyectoine ABC transporter ATP-binding protein EhuA n=1 Tax=Pandoraea terrae TaxID=1537710 RepID=A0A5E4TIN2_9BURK|nr:amino acid ABC transporter ATP-binding protein [Pandoraea terrae]VVD87866.1 ectoine/hydroxyectoine ABC transporter ATP-binding protein EhuA [Pandoraea terrae]